MDFVAYVLVRIGSLAQTRVDYILELSASLDRVVVTRYFNGLVQCLERVAFAELVLLRLESVFDVELVVCIMIEKNVVRDRGGELRKVGSHWKQGEVRESQEGRRAKAPKE